jgi:hypothetical protein
VGAERRAPTAEELRAEYEAHLRNVRAPRPPSQYPPGITEAERKRIYYQRHREERIAYQKAYNRRRKQLVQDPG